MLYVERKKLKKRMSSMPLSLQKGKYRFIIPFLILPVINFLIYYVGINFNSILMAFQKQIGQSYEWSFYNFKTMFDIVNADVQSLLIAIRNTGLLFLLDTVIMVPFSFYLTYCFYKKLALGKFFRVVIYLPTILPGMVAITSFQKVFGEYGVINEILVKMGFSRFGPMFANEKYAFLGVMFYCFWAGMSANGLYFLSAMRRIPDDVFEAAQLDGVGPFAEMTKVILPMMFSTVSMVVTLKISGLFMVDGPILLLTGGYHNTQTINFWIFNQTMGASYNFPAAAGLVFTLINLPIVIICRKIMNRLDSNVDY